MIFDSENFGMIFDFLEKIPIIVKKSLILLKTLFELIK